MRHLVKWRSHDIYLGQITAKVKMEFVEWVRQDLIAGAIRDMPVGPAQANLLRAIRTQPPYWNDSDCDADVSRALPSEHGGVRLHRLIMDEASNKVLSDDDILAMILEKQKDPASDYSLAMDAIREAANPDPKACTSESSGGQPGVTTTSASS